MTCKRSDGEACECQLEKRAMRAFCPNWYEPEHQQDADDEWQRKNFARLTQDQQERCIAYLRVKVPNTARAEWQDQAARGVRIGSTDLRFHFGVGMAVRNVLREVVPDDALPGEQWDDYYRGALYALVAAYPVPSGMLAPTTTPKEPSRVRVIRREPPRTPLPENFDG